MTTPKQYLELAARFDHVAEETPDGRSRNQIQEIADSYMTLAKSTRILNRSERILEELKRRQKR